MPDKYDFITDEMFDNKLRELVREEGVEWLLGLPGVWEIAAEELNNAVLDALVEEREEAEGDAS